MGKKIFGEQHEKSVKKIKKNFGHEIKPPSTKAQTKKQKEDSFHFFFVYFFFIFFVAKKQNESLAEEANRVDYTDNSSSGGVGRNFERDCAYVYQLIAGEFCLGGNFLKYSQFSAIFFGVLFFGSQFFRVGLVQPIPMWVILHCKR